MAQATQGRRKAAGALARRRAGFTLIELMLVMAILAVLAAIVVPKFTKRTVQAKMTAARATIANLELALDAYEVDNGDYPATEQGLAALIEPPGDSPDWHGPYIRGGVPLDPWGNPYIYRCPGQHNNDFDLYSLGPDGEEGTDDDIDNWSQR